MEKETQQDRRRDPESRQHSGDDDTIHLQQSEFEEDSYYLEWEENTEKYKQTQKELEKLGKNPEKKYVLEFVRNQIKNSKIKTEGSLDHLEQIHDKFWKKTITKMLKDIINNQIPKIPLLLCLKIDRQTLSLTRKQVYLILCHMFFVTIPVQSHCDISSFQFLYSSKNSKRPEANLQKLKCIVNYFEQVQSMNKQELNEVIVFQRLIYEEKKYLKCSRPLLKATITNNEIQTFKGQILIDFANKVLGGGVLFDGAVQEQILFVLHPQMMITKLICSSLNDQEVAMAFNIRQYSQYEGYSSSFKYTKPCEETKSSTYIAIDAFDFRGYDSQVQYQDYWIKRQIHKAYVGFHHEQTQQKKLIGDRPKDKRSIITGKWGCGVFGGDPQLKFIIQWLASSCALRKMVFVNWGGNKQSNQLYEKIISRLQGKKTSQIQKLLLSYQNYRYLNKSTETKSLEDKAETVKDVSLFTFILQQWK